MPFISFTLAFTPRLPSKMKAILCCSPQYRGNSGKFFFSSSFWTIFEHTDRKAIVQNSNNNGLKHAISLISTSSDVCFNAFDMYFQMMCVIRHLMNLCQCVLSSNGMVQKKHMRDPCHYLMEKH